MTLPEVERDPREPLLAEAAGSFLQREHLRHYTIDDAISREAFAEYLDHVDSGKLFLLGSHVAELRKLESRMDHELAAGNLRLARIGASLLQQRRKAVAAMVAAILNEPSDFKRQESVQTDPERLAFASTENELKGRWRKLLELQVLVRVARMEQVRVSPGNRCRPRHQRSLHRGS